MKLGMEVGLGPGHTVFDGDPAPPPAKRHSPQFSVHVCCHQTAGWTKMPLGREVDLGLGDIVLDGEAAPLPQEGGTAASHFSAHVYCGQTARWIKMPLGMQVGLAPATLC